MSKNDFPRGALKLEHMEVMRTPFRNLSGAPTKYNKDGGQRYFAIRLDPELALTLREQRWNVKELPPRDEQEPPLYFMEIKVNYKEDRKDSRNPKIVKVTPIGREELDRDVVGALDHADVEFVDLIINPYVYDPETANHANAFLQTAYFNIKMDELDMKYALEELEGLEDDPDPVVCDDEGICYINGVRIN